MSRRLPPPTPLRPQKGRPPGPSTAVPRWCRRHGVIDFHRYSADPGKGHIYRCKRCVGEAVTRRHHKVRRILLAEAGGRCAVCGYDGCVSNLHFHHVDPKLKAFTVNMSSGKSLAAYRDEAAKCVLVCANCHGEIESGLIPSPPPRARYSPSGSDQGRLAR